MTVIAFDGRRVAADKLSSLAGTKYTTTKLYRHGCKVIALAGTAWHGMEMLLWLKSGAVPDRCPTNKDDKTNAHMYVFELGKPVLVYEGSAIPHMIEDRFFAEGTGKDIALAAMHLGRSASEAVELAIKLDTHCGMGIDVIDLEELSREQDRGDGPHPSATLGGSVSAAPR